MPKKSILPQSPVCAVRADTSIGDCIKILRDKSIGALVITSANAREDIVGIFTERDLVKNIELIQHGNFWENPVRSIMTPSVRTVAVEKIEEGPKIMVRYNIRHLPVISVEKGRTHVIGVLSMRDLFRITMENLDYDINRVFQQPATSPALKKTTSSKMKRKLVGVFSADKSLRELVDKTTKLTGHLLMKALAFKSDAETVSDHLSKFDALFIDIDEMAAVQRSRLLAEAKTLRPNNALFVVFNPMTADSDTKVLLHKLADHRQIHLLAKPLAFGLFYEKFLKKI